MAYSYVPVDRDQLFLLPPDMSEWLPEGHLAWFVIDVVQALDLSVLHARHPKGAGRAAYDPQMMFGLLVYSYCCGVRSSRKIERLCETDAAFRVLCGGHRPDHGTIARFRKDHDEAMAELFVQVLELCRRAGLGDVGTVALDGTRVAGNSSKGANRSESWLRDQVAQMMGDAERTDQAEDDLFGEARGDEVPDGLGARGAERVGRLQECLAQLEKDRRNRDERGRLRPDERAVREDQAAAQGEKLRGRKPRGSKPDPVRDAEREATRVRANAAKRAARREDLERRYAAKGQRPKGPKPDEGLWAERIRQADDTVAKARAYAGPEPEPEPSDAGGDSAIANVTDPDSRLQKIAGGWLQGYNAQAMVSEDQVILAATVTNCPADATQFVPMLDETMANLAKIGAGDSIGIVLADAGYCSNDNLTHPGPDRLIATQKERRQRNASDKPLPEPPPDASPVDKMRYRLSTEQDAERYKRRAAIVEPVFGQNKEDRGFRRFSRRGLAAVDAEWQLICTTHNVLKLFKADKASPNIATT